MSRRPPSERELKLTAALYAKRPGVVEHVRRTSHLPESIPTGGVGRGLQLLIEKRGTDIELTEDERLVYDAILHDGRLPGGSVVLLDEEEKCEE